MSMSSTFVMPWTVDVDDVPSSQAASSQSASSQAVANVNAEEDDSDDSDESSIGIGTDEEMTARLRKVLNADKGARLLSKAGAHVILRSAKTADYV